MSGYPIPPGASPEIDRLRTLVTLRFPVYETRAAPRSVLFMVHVDPATLEAKFDALRKEMWEKFYVPQLRREQGEYVIEVVRRPPQTPWSSWANLVLLGLTVLTTVAAGAFLWVDWRGGNGLTASDVVNGGIFFALPLLAILGLHEFAHFVMARRHQVEASLPFFVPVPPPFLLFGTFGAFISLREPIPDKKALLDIGAAGPLAGFAVAIPVTLAGLALSVHAPSLPATYCGPTIFGVSYGGLTFGSSLLWSALGLFVPVAALAHLHPLALAGWVGLLVTAINLLPAGQLDGGHVFRALFGDRARFVSYAAVILLVALGFFYTGWLLFALLVFLLGMRHPPPLNDLTPLDAKRWAVGGLALAILVGGFVVIPLATPTPGDFALHPGSVVMPGPPTGYGMADNLTLGVNNLDTTGHGYVVSGSLVEAFGLVNGTSQPLSGNQFTDFADNSTWVVTWPNGTSETFAGTSSFSVDPSRAFSIPAGGSATFHVLYLNRGQAAGEVSVTVSELCSSSPASKSTGFTVS